MADIPTPSDPRYAAASEKLRQNGAREEAAAISESTVIVVYVCPGCSSYFGSSTMGRLEDQVTQQRNPETGEHSTTPRTRCPFCREPRERERRFARLIPQEEVAAATRRASHNAR